MGRHIYICVCFLLHLCQFATATTNFYMNDNCGGSVDVGLYDQIRVRLSRGSSSSHHRQCTLLLSTNFDSRMMVYYKDINIPDSGVYCNDNFLEIDDGSSSSSACLTGSCRQCGYSPPGGVYTTSGRYMFLNFQSQSQFTYASFDLIITSYHNGICNSDEHECDNGRCIDSSLTCNGKNSCGDYSDCEFILTVGGIAGVVIGCAVFITIIIIVIVVCRRRRRAVIVKQAVPVGTTVTPTYGYNQPVPNQYAVPPPYPGPTNQQGYQNY